MHSITAQLTRLASLLQYPGRELEAWLRNVNSVERDPGETNEAALCQNTSASTLERFASAMKALAFEEREELFTATFDVNPACVPYVSIHLFGEENFKRGEFMAGLQARYEQTGFNTEGELPDHLAVLLRFAAQTNETERRELVEFCLLGPVENMLARLSESNPYRALLAAVRETLQGAYPEIRPAPNPQGKTQPPQPLCHALSAGCNCGPTQPPNPRPEDPGREPVSAALSAPSLGAGLNPMRSL